MALPGLPTAWPKRQRRPRWLQPFAESFNLWGLVVLLLTAAVLWVVTSLPLDQTVEGTVETRSLSFQLSRSSKGAAPDPRTGFFAVEVQNLVISGLGDSTPVSFQLQQKLMRVGSGEEVEFKPPASETFTVALQLPPGTVVENLHREDPQELVVILRSPSGTRGPTSIDLSITPPASVDGTLGEASQGETAGIRSGLTAVQKPANAPARSLPTPDATFSLFLKGDARLRLRMANPTLVFEPRLTVHDVKFSTSKPSFFGGAPLILSNVTKGTLYFGRREPMQLRENQFLQMEAPGILELTDLRLDKHNLIVSVSGQSNRLRAGLSPERASTEVIGTLLSRHLSPDQINGFYGFMAGVIGSMVVVFFRAH